MSIVRLPVFVLSSVEVSTHPHRPYSLIFSQHPSYESSGARTMQRNSSCRELNVDGLNFHIATLTDTIGDQYRFASWLVTGNN
jgi:hypothetical protein